MFNVYVNENYKIDNYKRRFDILIDRILYILEMNALIDDFHKDGYINIFTEKPYDFSEEPLGVIAAAVVSADITLEKKDKDILKMLDIIFNKDHLKDVCVSYISITNKETGDTIRVARHGVRLWFRNHKDEYMKMILKNFIKFFFNEDYSISEIKLKFLK